MSATLARLAAAALGWGITVGVSGVHAQATQPGGYVASPVTGGGTIRGVVRTGGAPPAARTVRVTKDAEACGASQKVDQVSVGAGSGLAGVVVSLVDITRGAPPSAPAQPPSIDQRGCRFIPHVVLVPRGAPLAILNNDPITHNVHTVAFDNRPINRAQPRTVPRIELKFPIAEKVKVKCDIHEWMNAWIVVTEHPYHVLTDSDGKFVLDNVPPGTYKLEAWHDVLGATTQSVTVKAKETTTISVGMATAKQKP